MAAEFVARTFGLKRVALNHLFVPSTEGQLHAVKAGWAVGVLPELLVRPALAAGDIVDVSPGHTLPIQLYWHCWNLESEVLEALTQALIEASARDLDQGNSGR
jgi:LysR family transcriptional regulator (chromosome initiation inhibitor)